MCIRDRGDPSLEARVLLPVKAGRHLAFLDVELVSLGAVEVSVARASIPRGQPFTLRSVEAARTVARQTWVTRSDRGGPSVVRVQSLPPGEYAWQLGFEGYFGSGTVHVGGQETASVVIEGDYRTESVGEAVRIPVQLEDLAAR